MFRVTRDPIDLSELVRFVSDPEAGAIATFIGTTRNNNEGRRVIALDYEAYPEMAEKELARIGADATKRWQISRIAIVHRGHLLTEGTRDELADRHGERDMEDLFFQLISEYEDRFHPELAASLGSASQDASR